MKLTMKIVRIYQIQVFVKYVASFVETYKGFFKLYQAVEHCTLQCSAM